MIRLSTLHLLNWEGNPCLGVWGLEGHLDKDTWEFYLDMCGYGCPQLTPLEALVDNPQLDRLTKDLLEAERSK